MTVYSLDDFVMAGQMCEWPPTGLVAARALGQRTGSQALTWKQREAIASDLRHSKTSMRRLAAVHQVSVQAVVNINRQQGIRQGEAIRAKAARARWAQQRAAGLASVRARRQKQDAA